VHGFACVGIACAGIKAPEQVLIQRGHASALKPTHEAGRRGGDSIAR